MATEIERKFLVTGDAWKQGSGVHYSQAYLSRDKDRTVRVRIAGDRAFITVKGATKGASRAEFEYEIPVADAEQMLRIALNPIIQKIRREIEHEGSRWEVDEFLADNAGLVVAEIELESEDQAFSRPPWLGREVTHDPRYFNANLASHPYSEWRDKE